MADALQYDWVPEDWAVTDDPADPFGASADASVAIDPIQLPDVVTAAPHIDAAGNVVGYQEPERSPAPHIDAAGNLVGYQGPEVVPVAAPPMPQAAPAAPPPVGTPADPVAYDGGFDQFIQDDAVTPPAEPDLHAQPLDEYAGDLEESPVPEELWKPEAQTQENARVLDMSDERYLQHTQNKQAEADAYRAAELRQIEEDNRREMEHGREVERLARESTRQKLTDIGTRLEQLSQQHEDPSRWYADRSVPQKMALYASAMISGFLNPGGRNGAIELIQGEIDRDVESQRQNLNAQRQGLSEARGLVAEEYALSGDEFQAAETARLAKYGQAIKGLEQEMQRFDPMGSSAMKYRDGISELKARQAARAAALEQEVYKREGDAFDRQLRLNADQRAAEKHRKSMVGGGGSTKLSPELIRAQFGLDVERPMSIKELKERVGLSKDVKSLSGDDVESKTKATTLQKAEIELDVAQTKGDILDDDQQLLGRAFDPEKAPETRGRIEAYGNLRSELKDLYDLIAKKPTEQKLVGRWKSENAAAVAAQREIVAATYAKIVDPVGAVSDKTIDAAKGMLPDVEGWTEKKHPKVVYEQLVRKADRGIESHAKQNIRGYKKGTLTERHKADDRVLLAAPVAAPEGSAGPLENVLDRGLDAAGMFGGGVDLSDEQRQKLRELDAKDGD